jgi:hypothetical protein
MLDVWGLEGPIHLVLNDFGERREERGEAV